MSCVYPISMLMENLYAFYLFLLMYHPETLKFDLAYFLDVYKL